MRWWAETIDLSHGKSIEESDPDLVIYSDASGSGWGAYCEGAQAKGPWTVELLDEHIIYLELLAAFKALQTFTKSSSTLRVHVCLDNVTTVAYINKAGGTRSRKLCQIAQDIIFYCEAKDLSISASHVPGVLNSIVDRLSRELPEL